MRQNLTSECCKANVTIQESNIMPGLKAYICDKCGESCNAIYSIN